MKWGRFMSIPVLSVILVMGFVYYTTIFVYINDWVGLQSSAGTLNTSIFTLLASLTLFSLFVSVLTDPGHATSSFVPDVEGSPLGASDHELINNSSPKPRKCDKCGTYKPPRAHHCRVCRKCVLRMDHHCIWINNCVGHWNYKAFFSLISYATVSSIHSMVILVSCLFPRNKEFTARVPHKVLYVISGATVIGLSGILGSLLGWHIYLVTHNMTTIEYHEGKRAAWLAKKSGQTYRHLFDLSAYQNITSVLGPNMLKWLCPTSVSHLKNGTSYPTPHNS